ERGAATEGRGRAGAAGSDREPGAGREQRTLRGDKARGGADDGQGRTRDRRRETGRRDAREKRGDAGEAEGHPAGRPGESL
ncbi:hypothetical protein C3R44_23290, partial [Mycobacterium tuberculosis]